MKTWTDIFESDYSKILQSSKKSFLKQVYISLLTK